MSKGDLDTEWLEALEPQNDDTFGQEGADDEEQHREEESSDERDVDTEQGADEDTGEGESSEAEGGDDNNGDDSSEGEPEPEGEKKDGEEDDEAKTDEGETKEDDEKDGAEDGESSPKDAIREALREIDSEKAAQSQRTQEVKKEVTETLYPEGIDRQLRDSEGDPITGINDLTKLINPKTDDYFTEEEAGAWLLNAQQKLNKDVETVENFIEEVADTTIQLEEGSKRVAEKYGEILSNDDKLRTRLLESFNKTIIKDPKTGVAIKAPMDVEEFFDLALEPVLEQRQRDAEAASAKEKADKEAAEKAKKTTQSERGDLPPSGKADNLDPEDKEWAEAYKEYEEGAL